MGDLFNPPAPPTGGTAAPQGVGGQLTNFLTNPLIGSALSGYFGAIGAPRLSGLGGALSQGGLAAMSALPKYQKAQQEAQLFPLTYQKTQQDLETGKITQQEAKQKLQEAQELEEQRKTLTPEQQLQSRLDPTGFAQQQMRLSGNKDLSNQLTQYAAQNPGSDESRFYSQIAPLVAGSGTPVSMSDITSAFHNNQETALQAKLNAAQIGMYGAQTQEATLAAKRTAMDINLVQQMPLTDRMDMAQGLKPQTWYNPTTGQERVGTRPQTGEISLEQAPKTQDFYDPKTRGWSQGVVAQPGQIPGDAARWMLTLPVQYQGIWQKAYSDYINNYKASTHIPFFGGSSAEQLNDAAVQAANQVVQNTMSGQYGTGTSGGGVGTGAGTSNPLINPASISTPAMPGATPGAAATTTPDWSSKY
jgi:hypothetical protein